MKKSLVGLMLLVAFAAPAQAKLEKGDKTISVHLGVALPLSELDLTQVGGAKEEFAEPGGTIGGQFLYYIVPGLAIGVDLSGSGYDDHSYPSQLNLATIETSGASGELLGMVRGTFNREGRFHPFIEGGLGFSNTSMKIDVTPNPGLVWLDTGTNEKRTMVDDDKTGAAFMAGFGADLFITERLFLGGEGRWVAHSKRTYDPTPAGRNFGIREVEGEMSSFHLLARLGLKF